MLFEVSEARLRIPWIRNDLLPNLFSLKKLSFRSKRLMNKQMQKLLRFKEFFLLLLFHFEVNICTCANNLRTPTKDN